MKNFDVNDFIFYRNKDGAYESGKVVKMSEKRLKIDLGGGETKWVHKDKCMLQSLWDL